MSSVSKSRRKFITDSAKGAIAATVGLSAAGSFIASSAEAKTVAKHLIFTNFDQQPLPYKTSALEDVIDTMTMEIHYGKHAAAYAKNVKEAQQKYNFSLNEIYALWGAAIKKNLGIKYFLAGKEYSKISTSYFAEGDLKQDPRRFKQYKKDQSDPYTFLYPFYGHGQTWCPFQDHGDPWEIRCQHSFHVAKDTE